MSFDYDALRAAAADAAYGPDAGDNYWPEAEIIPLPVTPPTRPRDRWQDHAACAGTDPALFFPETGEQHPYRQARLICATCVVRSSCLQHALDNDEQYGLWGGTTPNERKKMKRGTA